MSKKMKWLFILYLPFLALILAIAIVAQVQGIPVGKFTRDIAAIAEVHPLKGVMSNIGILFWDATATICLFCGVVLWMRKSFAASKFLLWTGAITLVLLFDDFFEIHEDLAKRYLGIGEKWVMLAYGFVIVAYFLTCWRQILQTHFVILVVALVLFGCSILVDEQDLMTGEWLYLVEDGFKFLGIASWFGYHVWTAYQLTFPPQSPGEAGR